MRWNASDFERLDPKLFRSFLAVVRTQSFSQAAFAASLTQGAISQQVAKLEDRLNAQLFVRQGNRVITTMAGRMLSEYAEAYMDHAAIFLEQLNEEFESLRGVVHYAMPESCVHAPHFGWLLEKRKTYPELTIKIELKPTADVIQSLLASDVDFGFINRSVELSSVQAYPFCIEEYVLVCSKDCQLRTAPLSLDELLALPMILYSGMTENLNIWIASNFGEIDPISSIALRTVGHFNDMRGVLAMVAGDLGITVLPKHVAASSIETGQIRILDFQCNIRDFLNRPAMQQIWIVRLKERRMPARVKRVIRWFLEMHTELQPIPEEFVCD
ncbi:MAG: LysR family transcriptional regulator [Candidatus Saccharibacteria bacterium]|nr:LysR family transcriptional regulator [Candidatus Saccharibacteria bacterium]